MPKISFLVPVYNYQDYLKTCIESVLAQSDASWELLLVDDCSSDASAEICQAYAAQDERIRAIELEENQGQYQIINRYSLELSGEYTCVLDADDFLAPDYVAKMYACAHSGQDIVMCLHQNIANGKSLFKYNYGPSIWGSFQKENLEMFLALLQLEYFIIDCGTLVKNTLRHKIYPHLPKLPLYAATDDMQALFLALHTKNIAVLKKTLYYHNQGSAGTWRNKSQEFQLKKISSALISLEMIYYLVHSKLPKFPVDGLPMAENIRNKILETLKNMDFDERQNFYLKLFSLFEKSPLPFPIGLSSFLELEACLPQNGQKEKQEKEQINKNKSLFFIRLKQVLRSFKYFLPYGLLRYMQHKKIWNNRQKNIQTLHSEPSLSSADFLLDPKIPLKEKICQYQNLPLAQKQTCLNYFLQKTYTQGGRLSPSGLYRLSATPILSPKQFLCHSLLQPSKYLSWLLPYAWVRKNKTIGIIKYTILVIIMDISFFHLI